MTEFSTTLRVRYGEVDRMGAVNSARYFEWFELARSDIMRETGIPYGRLEESGIFAPVVEASCRYLSRIGYDELVRIDTTMEIISPVRLRFAFKVYRLDEAKEMLAAEGFTENAILGRDGRPTRLSPEALERLGALPDKRP